MTVIARLQLFFNRLLIFLFFPNNLLLYKKYRIFKIAHFCGSIALKTIYIASLTILKTQELELRSEVGFQENPAGSESRWVRTNPRRHSSRL